MVIYFVNTSIPARELPIKYIEPCFNLITQKNLPNNIRDLEGLFEGGFDPSIFIKFSAELKDIDSFVASFAKNGSYESEDTKSIDIQSATDMGYQMCYYPSQWQKRLGIELFDQQSLREGEYTIGSGPSRAYEIVVDKERNIVYAFFSSK